MSTTDKSTQLTDEEILERSKRAYAMGVWNQLDPVVDDEDRKTKIARRVVKQAAARNEKCLNIRKHILEAFKPAES